MYKSIIKFSLAIVFASTSFLSLAQNVGINSTGAAPAASAMLDVSSTTSGLLVPRMTNAQMNAIVAPAISLMVYNTTNNCFEFWTGVIWQPISCICTSPTPGPITGPLIVGINSINNVYSIAPVPGATGYKWTIVPAGGTITAGQGSTSITVSFGPVIQSYTICVYDSSLTCAKSAPSCLTVTSTNCLHNTVTFNYTGAVQTWTVPGCITQVTVTLTGGSGGTGGETSNNTQDSGGKGGTVTGVLAVVGGSVLNLYVGQAGLPGTPAGFGVGGWNGGGSGSVGYTPPAPYPYFGGGGGGASDIRVGGVALANRVVVAGGGGGAGFNYFACCNYDRGGPGGGLTGQTGWSGNVQGGGGPGTGGSQVAGGLGGTWGGYCTAPNGVLGIGSTDCTSYPPTGNAGAGGGGGYYGGGAGVWSGGGGGSSYVAGLVSFTVNSQGSNLGNGVITITY